LHDARKYDEAIQKYEQVLRENPDCTQAMYEMAFSLYKKPDLVRAEAMARRGAEYKSDLLPSCYELIGNVLDDAGETDRALEFYQSASKIIRDDRSLSGSLASINYNWAVTLLRLKRYPEMRPILKEGLLSNFAHPSSNYLMGELYYGSKYRIPALLAAARFLGLEQNTTRTKRAAEIILEILKPAPKDPATGQITIGLDFFAPKDEGEFAMYDLVVGTMTGPIGDEDKGKSPNQLFVEAIGTLTDILAEDKKLSPFFVGKTYVPYMDAMKKAGHQEAFAYLVLQQGGNTDAARWLTDNPAKLTAYFHWTREYRPATG
jgi:tetratricopeptide (TPR) repeat protein